MCVEMREDVNFNPSEMFSEDLQWSWKSRYRAWRWWCWHTASTLKGQGCHIQSHSETFVGQDAIHIEAKSATHTEAEEKIWAIYDNIRRGIIQLQRIFWFGTHAQRLPRLLLSNLLSGFNSGCSVGVFLCCMHKPHGKSNESTLPISIHMNHI